MHQVLSRRKERTAGNQSVRLNRWAAVVAICVLSAGCYTLEPAGISPELGSKVAFDVNDAGRVALGGTMGPEIAQIEGRLLSKDGNGGDYLIAVSVVRLLRGGEQVWRGEQVHIKPDYVSTIYLRRYSPGRTIALSAVGVAAVAAIAGASILGSGGLDPEKQPIDTAVSRRVPRPRSLPPRTTHHPVPPTTL